VPILKCANGRGWKYGNSGTCYTGKDAKAKAIRQGLAIGGGKLEKTHAVDIPVTISKNDPEKQYVFGWANVSKIDGELVVDSHNDTIDLAELENAAYQFALNFNSEAAGEMHKGEAKGRLIESFMVTPEKLEKMGLPNNALPSGWWIGIHITDTELFEKVKSGEYQAFSIPRSSGEG
jgi:hypothetical protein